MNYLEEIENEYKQITGGDFSFLEKHGFAKTEYSSLMLIYDNCNYDMEQSIETFVKQYLNEPEIYDDIYPYLKEFYQFYENKIFGNKERTDFMNKSAHVYINAYQWNKHIQELKQDPLYKYPRQGLKFVDLANGFNFIHFFPELAEETTYYLVDKSIFTCECYKIKIENMKLQNVVIINKDIKDLVIEDIGNNIAVIRANNIWRYIYDFKEYIPKLQTLIMKDGVFLFQEYSVNKMLTLQNNPYSWLESYFGVKWGKEFTSQNTDNIRALDTFLYRKMY